MTSSSNDDVGYRKPPKHSRFKKGQSGNPRGRPKGSKSLISFLVAALNEQVTVTENGRAKKISKLEATAKQNVNKALKGDHRALKWILEFTRDHYQQEEARIQDERRGSAKERVTKKLDELRARLDARYGLAPDGGKGPETA